MFCDKCQQIISYPRETQIEQKNQIKDLINCQTCSEKIVDRCHTCCWPIYKSEPVYESSRNISPRDIFIIRFVKYFIIKLKEDNFEKIIQCDWCYRAWKNDLEEREEKLEKKESYFAYFASFSLISALIIIYPEWIKRILDEHEWFKKIKSPYTFIILWSLTIFFAPVYIIDKITGKTPKADRYKDRKRVKEK